MLQGLADGLVFVLLLGNLFGCNLLAVHLKPGLGDVGHHKGNQERNTGHHLECKVTGGTVADGEGTLQVCGRRIIGSTVEAGQEEHGHHYQHRTWHGEPNAFAGLAEGSQIQAVQHQHHAGEQHHQHYGHGHEVVPVFERFQGNGLVRRNGIALAHQQNHGPAEEEEHAKDGE